MVRLDITGRCVCPFPVIIAVLVCPGRRYDRAGDYRIDSGCSVDCEYPHIDSFGNLLRLSRTNQAEKSA